MRNSVVAFEPSGFGQVLPEVMREFLGRLNWTMELSCWAIGEAGRPIAQSHNCELGVEAAGLQIQSFIIRQERRSQSSRAGEIHAIPDWMIQRVREFERVHKHVSRTWEAAEQT